MVLLVEYSNPHDPNDAIIDGLKIGVTKYFEEVHHDLFLLDRSTIQKITKLILQSTVTNYQIVIRNWLNLKLTSPQLQTEYQENFFL